ncbi:hypothetical protein MTO96_013095 [Rhipicephalus appendiculatus]
MFQDRVNPMSYVPKDGRCLRCKWQHIFKTTQRFTLLDTDKACENNGHVRDDTGQGIQRRQKVVLHQAASTYHIQPEQAWLAIER